MLFSCLSEGIKHRIVDTSYQARSSRYVPNSLGLRSQTLKLRFVTPETQGLFLKPTISQGDMVEFVEGQYGDSLPKPVFDRFFLGNTLSQIYAPYYVDGGKIFDAVLNRAVFDKTEIEGEPFSHSEKAPHWRIRFVPALCPACGWDLEGERDALALHCTNCNSIWHQGKEGFTKLTFGHFRADNEQIQFLPFWRIKAEISGIALHSYADLVRLANLPKVVQDEWTEREFRFWSPAFKVRPQDFLKFAQYLTLTQPCEEIVSGLPKGGMYPVTLAFSEAIEGLKVILASFMKPQKILFPKLPEIRIKAKSLFLVFIPFRMKGNELSQPDYRLRINKNLMTYARRL